MKWLYIETRVGEGKCEKFHFCTMANEKECQNQALKDLDTWKKAFEVIKNSSIGSIVKNFDMRMSGNQARLSFEYWLPVNNGDSTVEYSATWSLVEEKVYQDMIGILNGLIESAEENNNQKGGH